MSTIWIITRTSLLENSRKQIFHVLCLVMLTVIAGSTLLSILTDGVRLKMLKDLCMTVILFGGAMLSIALGASAVPNDVDSRTIHPIIARPLSRVQYLAGKFLGTFLTVALGVLAMSVLFGILIYGYQRSIDAFLPAAAMFALLEVAVVTAVATSISTLASPAVGAVLSFLVYVCGSIKIGYFGGLIERTGDGMPRMLYSVVYHLLPNLECFNLKTALVHGDWVPASYLTQVVVYGLCYTGFVLLMGSLHFATKEV